MSEITDLKLVKMTDRIYYLPNLERFDWPSLGIVIGDKHVMMLDSGASKRHVDLFLKELEANGLPKPDMCALTHWHWDHTYGLRHLDGVVSFATSRTNRLIKAMQSWGWSDREMKQRIETGEDLAFSYPHINDEYPDKSLIKIAPATVEFEDEIKIDLGGLTVIMRLTGNSHSDDCAIIYIPEEKCVFLGDIAYEDLLPVQPVYYEDGHRRLLSGLRKMDFDKVIIGHQRHMTGDELYAQLALAEPVKRD